MVFCARAIGHLTPPRRECQRNRVAERCQECREPLEQPRFGRRRKFHKACKKRHERRRAREKAAISPPISTPVEQVSPPETSLPWWEKERLGYFPGGTFDQYQEHYGYGFGGTPVENDTAAALALSKRAEGD